MNSSLALNIGPDVFNQLYERTVEVHTEHVTRAEAKQSVNYTVVLNVVGQEVADGPDLTRRHSGEDHPVHFVWNDP